MWSGAYWPRSYWTAAYWPGEVQRAVVVGRGKRYRVPIYEEEPEVEGKARQLKIVDDLLEKVGKPEFKQAKLKFREDPQYTQEVLEGIFYQPKEDYESIRQTKIRRKKKRLLLLLLLDEDL